MHGVCINARRYIHRHTRTDYVYACMHVSVQVLAHEFPVALKKNK